MSPHVFPAQHTQSNVHKAAFRPETHKGALTAEELCVRLDGCFSHVTFTLVALRLYALSCIHTHLLQSVHVEDTLIQ